MGKHNLVSGGLILVVVLMIAISTIVVVNYTTGIITAAVAFASTDQVAKLQACGVTTPMELFRLRADIPNFLLPALYVGFPFLMIIISILMFAAGYYHSSGWHEKSSSETTTTTSNPNRSSSSGRYETGRHVEKTQTQKSSESDGE